MDLIGKESEAVLRLRVEVGEVAKLKQAVDEANDSAGGADKALDKLAGSINNVIDRSKALGNAMDGGFGPDAKDIATWGALEKRIKDAADAYKTYVREQVAAGNTPLSAGGFAAANGLSNTDLNSYRSGNSADLVKDQAKDLKELERAQEKLAQQTTRVNDTAARHWIANEERKVAESRRAADAVARQWVAAEEARAAASRRAADMQARAWMEREEDRLGQIGGRGYSNVSTDVDSSLSARQKESLDFSRALQARMTEQVRATDQLTEAQARLMRAQDGLNDADVLQGQDALAAAKQRLTRASREQANAERALDLATDSGDIQAEILATRRLEQATKDLAAAKRSMVGATQAAEAELPRLRYAMYDVAHTASAASLAIGAVDAAVLVASAKYESAFTGVERTSGVTGTAVGNLREELIGLTRDIPTNFEDVAGVATLGAQLNIASGDLENFSEQVLKFSATAGVTNEQTAEGFGRIGQLLKVPVTEYENLGSAILYAGNSSVATEQDVLEYSQRLAIAGNEAGFTAQQIVALSATMASLGIGLEAAQGATQRIFQQIGRDVAEGGEGLERMAQIAGTSAQAFADSWQKEPQQAFSALINGLRTAGDLTGALDGLGIIETREVRAMTALVNNTELYNQLLGETNAAYQQGSYLADSYSKVVDDLASRWQIFLNSVMELGASLGDAIAPVASVLLNVLSSLAQGMAQVASTPLGRVLAGISLGAVSLAGAMAGVVAIIASARGAMLLLQTAIAATGWQGATTGVAGFTAGMLGMTTATGGAATALKVFRLALAGTGIGLAVLAVGALAQSFMGLGDAASKTDAYFSGGLSGLGEAMAKDAAALQEGGKAVKVFTRELPDQSDKTDDASRAAEGFAAVLGDVEGASVDAAKAANESALAWGETANEYIKNQLRTSEAFTEAMKSDSFVRFWNAIGADIDDAIEASVTDGQAGVDRYFAALQQRASENASSKSPLAYGDEVFGYTEFEEAQDLFSGLAGGLGDLRGKAQEAANANQILGDATAVAGDAAEEATNDFSSYGGAVEEAITPLLDAIDASLGMQNALSGLGESLGENGPAWDVYSAEGRANLQALSEAIEQIAAQTPDDLDATAANLEALKESLVNVGAGTPDVLQGVIDAIYETSDATVDAANTSINAAAAALNAAQNAVRKMNTSGTGMTLLDQLSGAASKVEQQGVGTVIADQLSHVERSASAASISTDSLFGGFEVGAEKARKEAEKLKEEVYTLADYASDLDGVMERAFDIRFGRDQALDSLASQWQDIRDSADEARKKAAEYKVELEGLNVDKSNLEYWLTIAEGYGDDKRAAELRQELAEVNQKAADTQGSLKEEQDKLSTSLQGGSQQAIQNREHMLGLVGGYQDYLIAMAKSGASQQELDAASQQLRQEFVSQATQLGYSRAEVERYATSFDDMRTVIQQVPRNITVTADANPALQALAEFVASARQAGDDAGDGIRDGVRAGLNEISGIIDAMPSPKIQVKYQLPSYDSLMKMQDAIRQTTGDQRFRISTGPGGQGGQTFRTGGYTGNGGINDVAGAVHGREFVFSAAATKFLGRSNLSYMHQAAQRGKTVMPGAGGGGGMDGATIAALAQAIGQAVSHSFNVDGRQVSSIVSGHFARANNLGAA